MLGNVLVDLRNVYPEALAEEAGFVYYGIGRTPPRQQDKAHRETPQRIKTAASRVLSHN